MYLYKTLFHKTLLLISACLATAGLAAAAPVIYYIDANTSSISGTSGYIDFQLAPGLAPQDATAHIEDFSTDGSVTGPPVYDFGATLTGGTTGSITSGLITMNNVPGNDYFQGFMFQNSFDFAVVLDGPAIESPTGTAGGSTFALSFYANDGATPLLTTNTGSSGAPGSTCDGSAGEIFINANGTATPMAYADTNGNYDVGLMVAPEPRSWLLLLGAAGLGLVFRRRVTKTS